VSEERKDQIIKLLTTNGAMGVNALAKALNAPTSTIQKYLHNQSYFKINDSKKWDLPEKVFGEVKNNQLELLSNVAYNSIALIRTNVEELLLNIDNALSPLQTLQRDIKRFQPPVAKSSDVGFNSLPRKWQDIVENLHQFPTVIKSKKNTTNPEMYKLLTNVNWYDLVLEVGLSYFRDTLSTDIYDVLLGQNDQLSEESIETLKEYQIGQAEMSDNSDM
jgi:hypothetical protein